MVMCSLFHKKIAFSYKCWILCPPNPPPPPLPSSGLKVGEQPIAVDPNDLERDEVFCDNAGIIFLPTPYQHILISRRRRCFQGSELTINLSLSSVAFSSNIFQGNKFPGKKRKTRFQWRVKKPSFRVNYHPLPSDYLSLQIDENKRLDDLIWLSKCKIWN